MATVQDANVLRNQIALKEILIRSILPGTILFQYVWFYHSKTHLMPKSPLTKASLGVQVASDKGIILNVEPR